MCISKTISNANNKPQEYAVPELKLMFSRIATQMGANLAVLEER